MLINIPEELKRLPQWVIAGGNKMPFNPRNHKPASVTDSRTWGTFEEAMAAKADHIGFVLTEKDPYSILDLDNHPNNPATEEQLARHRAILDHIDSYTELSLSGTGYHIVVKGSVPSGVNRDNVEIWSAGRYMIFTGKVLAGRTYIKDYQGVLTAMYGQMVKASQVDLVEYDEVMDDRDLVEMAMRASNGDKFNTLCAGEYRSLGYPSQSEADYALLNILAFYTRSDEQCRRIFRMSALGKREKATRNDNYLNIPLRKIRASQPAPIDFSQLAKNAEALVLPKSAPEPKADSREAEVVSNQQKTAKRKKDSSEHDIFPPGLVGEIAEYIYSSSVRPVKEISLAAAIALTAGVCGRSYNISRVGLSQYIILVAGTGTGKEGAQSGIDRLLAAVRPSVPMVDQFRGPSGFGSGQGLIKAISEKPCFLSILGEFGLTLQHLSDPRANSSEKLIKRVLLDLYGKSGWDSVLQSTVYSDVEKNTKVVQAPNLTILGETTPDTFFEGLSLTQIKEGLIPRFTIVEYQGERPDFNEDSPDPDKGLVQKLADLVAVSLTTSNNHQVIKVQQDKEAYQMLKEFNLEVDRYIRSTEVDALVQLWNRAHVKALKMAGLLAVGINPHQPIITKDLAEWAIAFVRKDVSVILTRFQSGDVGQGDSKQLFSVREAVKYYLERPYDKLPKTYQLGAIFHKHKVIPFTYFQRKLGNTASMNSDRMGATFALHKTLKTLVSSGELIELDRVTIATQFDNYTGQVWAIGKSFK